MKTGLILIDLQNDYFTGGAMELNGIEEAGEKAGELLSFFRGMNLPVFHVQHVSAGGDSSFFLPDTAGVEIHRSVEPLPGEMVIRKHYPNAFLKTGLRKALRSAGVERLVFCGAMSHMCVDATVRAGADLGFNCLVVHDACATTGLDFSGRTVPAPEVHASFMAALGSAYAKVVDLDEFVSLNT
jgi:nicotinamidase-related amidase